MQFVHVEVTENKPVSLEDLTANYLSCKSLRLLIVQAHVYHRKQQLTKALFDRNVRKFAFLQQLLMSVF